MISGIIKAWWGRGAGGRKEGMASYIEGQGFREGFKRS